MPFSGVDFTLQRGEPCSNLFRKQRDAVKRTAAKARLDEEVSAARNAATAPRLELDGIEREILRAHGALEQVGGAVAREQLRDATEAFDLAARQEREIEAESEGWKLLLEQMNEADAAQASNLGQALGPAIAGRFEELTRRRYETVQLTAQLATEGIMVSGAVRATEQISVGTREQLSTLYRLSLAECLGSMIVLEAVDQQCSRINGAAPATEHRRLLGVELTARKLAGFGTESPSIAKELKLPDFDRSNRMMWPPPQRSLAAVLAMSLRLANA